ncbi:MAG: V-type ATPase subunit [Deltaproteobacteria bacterium]
MSQLKKYAYANAKIRAMLSRLLDEPSFESLLSARDLREALDFLARTQYAPVFEKLSKEEPDIHRIEEALTVFDEDVFRKVASILQPSEKEFVDLLLEKYEIEALKVALRLWHKRVQVDPAEYLPNHTILHAIDYGKLLKAQDINELIVLLSETPYFRPLARGRDKYKETGSLFYLEVSLDIDYYQRVLKAVGKFSEQDKSVAMKILGIEIDIENINWLVRLRKYYDIPMGDMLEWIIPGGERIDRDSVRKYYTADGMGKLLESLAIGPYGRLKDLSEQNIHLIENFLYEVLLRQVKRALAGFPFSIGTVLGYLTLKRKETRNIISVLNAKRLGWKKDDVLSLITF